MATVTGFLAPNPRFQMRDKTGLPARAGQLFTYVAGTTTPKATYMDAGLTMPNTNPVIMNMAGEALIYWADDELYRIIAQQSDDQLIYDQDNYPITNGGDDTPIVDISNISNLVRNPQFTYWTNTIDYPPIMLNVATSQNDFDFIADDWLFSKTCADSTITFTQGTFTAGDAEVPGYAPNYISFDCTGLGSRTETNVQLYQNYGSVQTFGNSAVTLVFSARCRGVTEANLIPHLYQYFGTGSNSPSPTVDNFVGAVALSEAWQQFRQTITLSNINGKTIGNNLDDQLQLSFQYPSNALVGIDIDCVQLTPGQNTAEFIIESQNDQQLRLYRNTSQLFYTSDHIHTLRSTANSGWLVCDDTTVGNPASGATHAGMFTKALFGYLWLLSPLYVPIYNSDGTVGSRSSSANADFNLNKRLALTKALGRDLAGVNPNSLGINKTFTASSSSGLLLTFDTTIPFVTGMPVQFSNTGGALPTGLSPATTYYLSLVDGTTTHVCTSTANVVSGTFVTYTDAGTGINTMSMVVNISVPGQYLGEFTHLDTIPEMPSHNHPGSNFLYDNIGSTDVGASGTVKTSVNTTPFGVNVAAQGGNTAHNILNPKTYLYTHLKL